MGDQARQIIEPLRSRGLSGDTPLSEVATDAEMALMASNMRRGLALERAFAALQGWEERSGCKPGAPMTDTVAEDPDGSLSFVVPRRRRYRSSEVDEG
jgi:hypothetical protein